VLSYNLFVTNVKIFLLRTRESQDRFRTKRPNSTSKRRSLMPLKRRRRSLSSKLTIKINKLETKRKRYTLSRGRLKS